MTLSSTKNQSILLRIASSSSHDGQLSPDATNIYKSSVLNWTEKQ